MSSQEAPCNKSNSREKRLSSKREGRIFWIFFRIKQVRRCRTGSFKEQADIHSCIRMKEGTSQLWYLLGNFLSFLYCMTELLLVLSLSWVWVILNFQTSSIVVPNHHYKPDPSPVAPRHSNHKPPDALKGFIGFCSSSYCTETNIFCHLTMSSAGWCLNLIFFLIVY